MNETLEYIKNKYNLDLNQPMPITLKMSRFHEFARLLHELGFKVGAEIGVAKGKYSQFLCMRNPGVKLYCIDPWENYSEYVEHHEPTDNVLNECYEVAKSRLAQYDATLIRKYSMDAVNDFEDNSLDFVFIDGNHSFEYVVADIAAWSKKVRPGGIIAGHDYWNSIETSGHEAYVQTAKTYEEKLRLCQVKDAVDAWTKTYRIGVWFITKGDSCPSWFWVKE